MSGGKIKKEKKSACPTKARKEALRIGTKSELLTELDTDEILAAYGSRIADRESKKKPIMKVSGKSVFRIKEIIVKKSKDNRRKT